MASQRTRMSAEQMAANRQQARTRMQVGLHPEVIAAATHAAAHGAAQAAAEALAEHNVTSSAGLQHESISPPSIDETGVGMGQRINTSGNGRAGQQFSTYAKGDTEYHVYNQGGQRRTVAVKPPAGQLAQAVLAKGSGEVPDGMAGANDAALARLAAARSGATMGPAKAGQPGMYDLIRQMLRQRAGTR